MIKVILSFLSGLKRQRVIDKHKYLDEHIKSIDVFQKGKRYKIEGGKDIEYVINEDNSVSINFTAASISVTQIGCIANFSAASLPAEEWTGGCQ